MSAAGPSNYTFLEISKPSRGTSVRLEGKILGFNYFESVYSPMITANVIIEDVGGTVANPKTGLRGTLKDALPIEGFEEIADWFETLAKAEKSHAGKFQKTLESIK